MKVSRSMRRLVLGTALLLSAAILLGCGTTEQPAVEGTRGMPQAGPESGQPEAAPAATGQTPATDQTPGAKGAATPAMEDQFPASPSAEGTPEAPTREGPAAGTEEPPMPPAATEEGPATFPPAPEGTPSAPATTEPAPGSPVIEPPPPTLPGTEEPPTGPFIEEPTPPAGGEMPGAPAGEQPGTPGEQPAEGAGQPAPGAGELAMVEPGTSPPAAAPDVQTPLVDDAAALKPLDPNKPLWIDPQGKRVVMIGQVCQNDVPLEMFACLKDTKEHESVVTVDVEAYKVHAGLMALGAKPGQPVQWNPDYVAASGPVVDVTVRWKDKDGKVQTARAQDWIRDVKTGKAMGDDWVFAGSRLYKDEFSGREIYEAEGGDFICVSNFSSAMLDLPIESSQSNDALLFHAFKERIPPKGTAVTIILTPKLEKPPAETPAAEAPAAEAK